MQHNIHYYLIPALIYYSEFNSIGVKALLGSNIRSAMENEFPFAACLSRMYSVQGPNCFCSGTLVTHYHVLTVEHCFYGLQGEPFSVILGSTDYFFGTTYYVLWWISYTYWARRNNKLIRHYHNDIAMLKLIGNVTSQCRPAPVSSISPMSNLFGLVVQTIGYGLVNNYSLPTELQTANLTIISKDICNLLVTRYLGYFYGYPESYLCSMSNPITYLGPGDSGGPILYNGEVVGVAVAYCPNVIPAYQPAIVNVHASVDAYRDFIHDTMNN